MNSAGYDFAKAYSDWVSQNQQRVAKMRLGDSLSALCERKFRIPFSVETLQNWNMISAPMLCELLNEEESSEDIFDTTLPLRKKEILTKYMGSAAADKYEDQFSLHHDAYQMIQRLHTFVWMAVYRV